MTEIFTERTTQWYLLYLKKKEKYARGGFKKILLVVMGLER